MWHAPMKTLNVGSQSLEMARVVQKMGIKNKGLPLARSTCALYTQRSRVDREGKSWRL